MALPIPIPPRNPSDCAPWLYETLTRLRRASIATDLGMAAIQRGEIPDSSGRPLPTTVVSPVPFIYITLADHLANPALIQSSLGSFVGGGIVQLGPGNFGLTGPLTVPFGVQLRGSGMFVTYLWYGANVNLDIITITGSYVTISDLSVRGVNPATQYGNGYGSVGTGRGIVVAVPDGGSTGFPVYFPTIRNVEVANTPSWCIYDTGQQHLVDLGTGISPDFDYALPGGGTNLTGMCISVCLTLDNVQLAFPNSGGALYIGSGAAAPRISNILTNSYSFNTMVIAGVREPMGAVQLYNAADAIFSGKCAFQSPTAQPGGMPVVHADTDAVMLALLQSATAHFVAPYFEVLSFNCAGGPGRTHWMISTINSSWVMERPYAKSTVYDPATSNGYPLRIVHSPLGETIGSSVTIRDGQFFHYRESYPSLTAPRYLPNGAPTVLDRDDIALLGSGEGDVTIENCTVINYSSGATRNLTTPASPNDGFLVPARPGASFSNTGGVLQFSRFNDCNLVAPVSPSDLRQAWSYSHDFSPGVVGYVKGVGNHVVGATLNSTVNVVALTAGQFDQVEVGNLVQGTGLGVGTTYVTAKADNSNLTLSIAATVSAPAALTFFSNGTFQREGLWCCSNRSGPDFRQVPYIRMHPSIWPGVEPGDMWMVLGSPVASVYTTARFFWYDGANWQTQIDRSIGTAAGDLIKYTASDTPARLAIGTAGQLLTVVGTAPTWVAPDFADNLFLVHDDGDITKKLAFQCSGITTGQTRTVTVKDASGTMALDPTAATGDLIYRASTGFLVARTIGSAGDVLTVSGGLPIWTPPPLVTDYADNTFTIHDDGTPTKKLAFQCSGITAATTRTLTVPDASGLIALDPTSADGDIIYRASTGFLVARSIGGAGQFLTSDTGLPTWSNPIFRDDLLKVTDSAGVRTLMLSAGSITLAQTRTLLAQDVSGSIVPVGNVTGTTAASGTLGRSVMPTRTADVAAQTLLTGNTTSGGLYRVSFYLKTNTAGTAGVAKTKVTVSWNDGTAQTLVVPFLNATAIYNDHDLGTLNAYSQGSIVVSVAASQNISFITTGTYTGSPQYTLNARIEALG